MNFKVGFSMCVIKDIGVLVMIALTMFLMRMPFVSYMCLIALTGICNTVLNSSCEMESLSCS